MGCRLVLESELQRKRVLRWLRLRNEKYLNDRGCRNKKSCLTSFRRHGYTKLLKREAIHLCYLVRL